MKPARTPLREDRPYLVRTCVTCGQEWPTQRPFALYCSGRCMMRSWRAAAKLAGTHDGYYRRLKAD